MAEVKIYRVIYVYDDTDDAGINFSGWVQFDGIDEVLATIPPWSGVQFGAPVEPTILGWEEKTLDTDPF